jgi:hypothetical protein
MNGMQCIRLRLLPGHSTARSCIASLLALVALGSAAQMAADRFPAAAMTFLDAELPQMEAAVSARDRDYFEQSMTRMLDFSETWGFRTRANPALARYSMCTEALSDFTIVGLCRIAPSLDGCEPGLPARFDANVRRCRELAR